jgi:hypothetical protein
MIKLLQQSKDHPLYPEVLWDKPENSLNAGKICIIGGNAHAIKEPNEAYQISLKNILKERRVVLPESTKKYFSKEHSVPDILFAPSNISGSFSAKSLIDLQTYQSWADCTIFAGDFTKSSETTILINKLIDKSSQLTAICNDGIDIVLQSEISPLQNSNLIITCSLAQLQKLCICYSPKFVFTSNLSPLAFYNKLSDLSSNAECYLLVMFQEKLYVAYKGQVVISDLNENLLNDASWATKITTVAAIWSMQQPAKRFQALVTGTLFAI